MRPNIWCDVARCSRWQLAEANRCRVTSSWTRWRASWEGRGTSNLPRVPHAHCVPRPWSARSVWRGFPRATPSACPGQLGLSCRVAVTRVTDAPTELVELGPRVPSADHLLIVCGRVLVDCLRPGVCRLHLFGHSRDLRSYVFERIGTHYEKFFPLPPWCMDYSASQCWGRLYSPHALLSRVSK
jgi:hypothetical protein